MFWLYTAPLVILFFFRFFQNGKTLNTLKENSFETACRNWQNSFRLDYSWQAADQIEENNLAQHGYGDLAAYIEMLIGKDIEDFKFFVAEIKKITKHHETEKVNRLKALVALKEYYFYSIQPIINLERRTLVFSFFNLSNKRYEAISKTFVSFFEDKSNIKYLGQKIFKSQLFWQQLNVQAKKVPFTYFIENSFKTNIEKEEHTVFDSWFTETAVNSVSFDQLIKELNMFVWIQKQKDNENLIPNVWNSFPDYQNINLKTLEKINFFSICHLYLLRYRLINLKNLEEKDIKELEQKTCIEGVAYDAKHELLKIIEDLQIKIDTEILIGNYFKLEEDQFKAFDFQDKRKIVEERRIKEWIVKIELFTNKIQILFDDVNNVTFRIYEERKNTLFNPLEKLRRKMEHIV